MLNTLIIFVLIGQVLSQEVKLKGGLIYNQEGTAQVNQDSIQYTRLVDTTGLFNIAQKLKDCTTLYTTFCKQAEHYNLHIYTREQPLHTQPKPYIVTPLKYPIKEAGGVCKRLQARLPEVRDLKTYNEIRTLASEHDVTRIAAGVKYDSVNNVFTFMSDGANARTNSQFQALQYGGSYIGKLHTGQWEDDRNIQAEAKNYPVIYRFPKNDFNIRIADSQDRDYPDKILCEKHEAAQVLNDTQETNLMSQLAVHACRRDAKSVVANTLFTLNEINQITTLNFTAQSHEPDWNMFFPEFKVTRINRQKRSFEHLYTPKVHNFLSQHVIRRPNQNRTSTVITHNTPHTHYFQNEREGYFTQHLTPPLTQSMFYENYVINTPSLNTIPDLVIALHSFYLVQLQQNFHQLSFEDWMLHQAFREPIYKFLKYIPKVTRIPRDLNNKFVEASLYIESLHLEKATQNLTFLNSLIQDIEQLSQEAIDAQKYQLSIEHLLQIINVTTLQTKIQNFMGDENVHDRHKRSIIAAAAGLAAGAGIAAAAIGTGSYLSSAQKNSPDEATLEIFKQQAKVLTNVQINQKQLSTAMDDINTKLSLFENQIVGKFEGIAAVTLESDLRALINQLQTVIQVTLLKFNSAIIAAATTKTSPYVLSQTDIDTISDSTFKSKGLHITTNLNLIKTLTLIENNLISFIFEIPIIDPRKEFSLFTISYLPSFKDGLTYLPLLDSDHIAINSHGDKYTTFTTNELNRCLDTPPTCISRKPIIPIRDGSSCTALTYITDLMQCHYKETDTPPRHYFLFYDVQMFFSVPNKTQIYGKCFKNKLTNNAREDTLNIEGVGQVRLQPTCTLTLPDGTTHTTPSRPSNISDMKAPIFSELNNFPGRTDFVITDNTQFVFQNQNKVHLKNLEILQWDQVLKNSFHPANTVSTITIITLTIISLLIIFILMHKFCPNQLSRCCCTDKIRNILLQVRDTNPSAHYSANTIHVTGTKDMWYPDPEEPPANQQFQTHNTTPTIRLNLPNATQQPFTQHNTTSQYIPILRKF